MHWQEKVEEAAALIRARLDPAATIAVVLGSGLGALADQLSDAEAVAFAEIPHFPAATVAGHSGRLVRGDLAGVPLLVMQGRVHAYEGYSSEEVVFPVRVLAALGVKTLVLTNAAGGIRLDYHPGQLVLLSDHINLSGRNPAAGPVANSNQRFFDMSEAYSPRLRTLAESAAADLGFTLEEGVYLSVLGPSFETPAEIRAFRSWGADLVGMSTVQETIAARQIGLHVLGISCVTNMAAGVLPDPLSHEEVMVTGRRAERQLLELLSGFVRRAAEIGA
jgi:purine-nucleoside phosphorylase